MEFKKEYVITVIAIVIAILFVSDPLAMVTGGTGIYGGDLWTLSVDESIIIEDGTLRHIDTGTCCIPKIEITAPWGEVKVVDMPPITEIIMKNPQNSLEEYKVRTSGLGTMDWGERISHVHIEAIHIVPAVFCPAVYNPVCGVDGVTYSNSCKANVAGVEIDYYRACGTEEPTAVPTATPVPDDITPVKDLSDKNLLWRGIFIGMLLIVVIVSRRKK